MEMKREELKALVESVPPRTRTPQAVIAEIAKAAKELPEHISLRVLSESSGVNKQTLHHRVANIWKLRPVEMVKIGRYSVAVYSRDEILKKAEEQ